MKMFIYNFAVMSNSHIIRYEILNKYFVETANYIHAEKTFFRKGIVIFTGRPGCGKTMAAIHLILKLLKQDAEQHWTFRIISTWEQLKYIQNDKKSLVFIDNIFFRGTMDKNFLPWWYHLETIHKQYLTPQKNELVSNRLRIIMTTAGTDVIKRACAFMGKSTPIFDEKLLTDVEILSEIEKEQIFLKQVEFAKKEKNVKFQDAHVDENFRMKIKESKGPIGFPLCANLYACCDKYREKGWDFFSRPIDYLKHQIKDEIKGEHEERIKSLFFCMFFFERQRNMGEHVNLAIRKGELCRQFLTKQFETLEENFGSFDFKEMEREAQRLFAFFKDIGKNEFRFVHDSVYEAVGSHFCEQFIEETAMYFPLDIIQNQYFEKLTKQQNDAFVTRLLEEIGKQRLSEVFACKIFRNPVFAKCFCSELEKKDKEAIERFFTLSNTCSAVKLPVMFWCSRYNLASLTESLFHIITNCIGNTENTEKQLFVSLYGICCAKNEGSLEKVVGSIYEEFDKIKKHVLDFNDDIGNSILHLIISSDFSDEFVTSAVKNLGKNKTFVDCKNKTFVDCKNDHKVTPIMLAVEQPIRREKVIKALLEMSAKLQCRDKNTSTVFHHCLGSINNDEICAEYLDLLLKQKKTNTINLLCKDNVYGDTVLSIAARESKHSRIQSILILLESNTNIIDTVDKNGYSPLHLCVRSLTGNHPSAELECCVRVILFILYGADPRIKSDEDDKAIDQCKYSSVKTILNNYEDNTTMSTELDGLIERMNLQESFEDLEKVCISSEVLCLGMRERVAKAIKCIQKSELVNNC